MYPFLYSSTLCYCREIKGSEEYIRLDLVKYVWRFEKLFFSESPILCFHLKKENKNFLIINYFF